MSRWPNLGALWLAKAGVEFVSPPIPRCVAYAGDDEKIKKADAWFAATRPKGAGAPLRRSQQSGIMNSSSLWGNSLRFRPAEKPVSKRPIRNKSPQRKSKNTWWAPLPQGTKLGSPRCEPAFRRFGLAKRQQTCWSGLSSWFSFIWRQQQADRRYRDHVAMRADNNLL
jgi:hypothetical protein